jgi:hypothetical protein
LPALCPVAKALLISLQVKVFMYGGRILWVHAHLRIIVAAC